MTPESKLRQDAAAIFRAAIDAAQPGDLVERRLQSEDWAAYRNVFVIGAGKAAGAMAQAAERVLGDRINGGLVNVKTGHHVPLQRIEQVECAHPIPDEIGVHGATRIAEIAAKAGPGDLVVCLVSGGASALMPLPAGPLTLAEKQNATQLLLDSGAAIHEINCVRKHMSAIKGGQLARIAHPARVLTLLLSDVIGDDLGVIGSGPTAPDESTFSNARAILEKYQIWERIPNSIRERIVRGTRGQTPETPKPGDPVFTSVHNEIIANNALAASAAAECARGLGYHTLILSTFVAGETRDIARMHGAIASQIARFGQPVKPPACIITGGETTVTKRGDGLGGRNQEFVLASVPEIAGLSNVLIFSAGTDGTDGPTEAAGAIADGRTLQRDPRAAEFLARNDSYHYFAALNDLVITGSTQTNVMDVHLILVGEQP